MKEFLSDLLAQVIFTAVKAGGKIMEIYHKDFSVKYKDDKSPLTEADKLSNEIICDGLKQLTPAPRHTPTPTLTRIPILSEENKEIPYDDRKNWDIFWLVDPLDGTKEFIKKNGEFTVNIALIHKDSPVLGVVYAPAINTLYYAAKGLGAYKSVNSETVNSERRMNEILKNSVKLPVERDDKDLIVVASRSHMNQETQNFIEALKESSLFTNHSSLITTSIGSSLKICLVAEGKADIYPRLGPTMEWDTAAAHAIVKEAGGEIYIYDSSMFNVQSSNLIQNPESKIQNFQLDAQHPTPNTQYL
ncbi:3'(2'),5'-bisphosphate nucleotidase CysQ [Hippea maritima]|uniref:3'(2'),5'-bisphosphate nucleotidase CysQ n=1 Tax=Hippea maritima (strain ATCC 700847 / DSM 10411 / MH2) TaxID=760142 RepID=F2LWR2_HIPMA|nr:3'(2'),5'-bisphosphate nucleotidase CysQ [Hippea maritima]AEA33040.1 3'(2'),5'-bisphosphate nucleotidase [Hippea maritima DSM 10411]